MRLSLPVSVFFTCCACGAAGQAVLYSENFETAPSFTLNTTDAGSTISPWNTWVINNSYTGGTGDVLCLGFPFPYTIVNTAGQPAAVLPQNGSYLHTASVEGIADGITCCSFGAADGFCITADQTFSRMTNDVSTSGYSDVDFSFWWLCEGSTSHYGQVYYSINGGVSWSLISVPITNYSGQSSWVQQVISQPDFGNQATLRFGFKFVNSIGGSALDPGFGIDNVEIIGQGGIANSIATQVSNLQLCTGSALSVDFVVQGNYLPGNVFTAQLSDAFGSFASPVAIGTLAGTASGSIPCVIPPGTPVGTGYRVRVVSDTPPTVGADNGSNISIGVGASAGVDTNVQICKATGTYDLFLLLGGNPDVGGSWTNPNNQLVSGIFDSAGQPGGDYTYTVTSPPPCPASTAVLNIVLVDQANAGVGSTQLVCSTSPSLPMIGFLSSSPDATGYWLNPGNLVTDQLFDPQVDVPGLYTYVVPGTGPCPNDSAFVEVQIVTEPDAGTSSTAVVCENDPPVDLITLLGGTPDPGGSWTDPGNAAHGPLFDPDVDPPGLYTYTVDPGAPCVAASASVAVVLDPCTGIGETPGVGAGLIWSGSDGSGRHTLLFTGALDDQAVLSVEDAAGRVVLRRSYALVPQTSNRLSFELDNGPSGVYLVRVVSASAEHVVRLVH